MKAKYKNWKGKVSVRRFIPIWLFFGNSKYHPYPRLQWFLIAWDLDKKAIRCYAAKDFYFNHDEVDKTNS